MSVGDEQVGGESGGLVRRRHRRKWSEAESHAPGMEEAEPAGDGDMALVTKHRDRQFRHVPFHVFVPGTADLHHPARIRVLLRRQDQDLEHGNRIVRSPATPRAVGITKRRLQRRAIRITDFERCQMTALREELDHEYEAQNGLVKPATQRTSLKSQSIQSGIWFDDRRAGLHQCI